MSDAIYVTCACGYEIQVPASALGTTQECINCGADIVISEETVQTDRSVHEPGTGTQRDTSRLTMEPEEPSAPLSPFDPTVPAGASAFEDESEQEEFSSGDPWKPADAPARSPFEDDSEEPEEIVDAKPQPTHPAPRVFTEVTERDTHKEVGEEETCPRCGNPYRGDWDKQTTGEGEMCYICSNQATEKIPERLKDGPRDDVYIPPADRVVVHAEGKPQFWLFDTESVGFRRMLWALAVGTILLTVFLYQTDDYQSPIERQEAAIERGEPVPEFVEEPAPELPGWARVAMWTWQWVASMATCFVALYVVLYLRNKLPHETIKANAIVIGVVTVILTAMTVALSLGFWWLGDMSYAMSILIGTMVSIAFFFAQIIILMRMLDFGILDLILVYLIFGFAQAFVQAISAFFYWGLASVAL